MAAYRQSSTVPNTPLLHADRHQNGTPQEEARLPSGGCNFTNLSIGGNAPRCGCKRFWDKATVLGQGTQTPGRSGFCMCEHHACYHDDGPQETPGSTAATPVPKEPVETARTLDSLPKPQSAPIQHPRGQVQLPDERSSDEHEDSIPDTLQWGQYVSLGPESHLNLPAIPSQCLLPSESSSVTSGCGSSFLKPFGGLGLRAIHHIRPSNSAEKTKPNNAERPSIPSRDATERRMQIYEDAYGNNHLQSLTEEASVSARTSQDPREVLGQNISIVQDALDRFDKGKSDSEVALRPASSGESIHVKQSGSGSREQLVPYDPDQENLLPRIKHVMGQLMDVPNKISNHEQRIDRLESTSFSNAQVEDLREDVETRFGDLEERVNDIDRQMLSRGDGSICGRNHLSSFGSRASVTSSALDLVDSSRVEAMEAQIAELQASALPSHSNPWEIDVVFLPFGPRLMGIWSSQSDTPRRRSGSTMTEGWTQTQNSSATARSVLSTLDQASTWEMSATTLAEKETEDWLMARACGMQSRVDERLRSRGLVKSIQVYGPEARDVQVAMMQAFNDLPDILAEDPYTLHDENAGSVPTSLRSFLGLSSTWVPLRKVHKNSSLRLLHPSEMVTPALWTVPFLASSVAMRHAKVRRLYITHRDAYIQHLSRHASDWTWQKLRQLPRVYPDQPSFSHTPEADAHEPCWEYDERLDPPRESVHSSFASQISSLSIRARSPELDDMEPTSPSDHFSSAAVSRHQSTTPTSVAHTGPPTSPLKERNPFRTRPVHGRTTSMPTIVPTKSPHMNNKRRITSFDHEHDDIPPIQTRSSPSRTTSMSSHALQLKRRRTRSPSKDITIVGPGSTWGAGPPSPYTFVDELAGHNIRESKGKDREMDRGTTPFAYATPHSNAPYIERDRDRSGGTISVYEDESAAGDENFGGDEEVDEEITEEIDFDMHGDEIQHKFETDLDMAARFNRPLPSYNPEDDHDGNDPTYEPGDDESIDLDQSLSMGQERQIEEEWEGLQEQDVESFELGMAVADTNAPEHVESSFEDEDEDDNVSESSSLPSEYPSTQQRRQIEHELNVFEDSNTLGFRIHVDDDEDDELVS